MPLEREEADADMDELTDELEAELEKHELKLDVTGASSRRLSLRPRRSSLKLPSSQTNSGTSSS
jgi:hypothetical protein